jgi:multidrug efflux pump subunit AcrB
MVGVGRQLFVPLSLTVGFAIVSSYVLSTTLVPLLATWMMKEADEKEEQRRPWHERYLSVLRGALRFRWVVLGSYAVIATVLLFALVPLMHLQIFPSTEAGQIQLRLRAPTGTRIERTELIALKALDIIKREVGPDNVQIESDFVGVQSPNYPVNTIYLFTSGPQESVMLVRRRTLSRMMSFGSPTPVEIAVQGFQRRCQPQLR